MEYSLSSTIPWLYARANLTIYYSTLYYGMVFEFLGVTTVVNTVEMNLK